MKTEIFFFFAFSCFPWKMINLKYIFCTLAINYLSNVYVVQCGQYIFLAFHIWLLIHLPKGLWNESKIWKTRKIFFFLSGFPSQIFTNHRIIGERGENFINASLPLPPASQTLDIKLGDYCRGLTSPHS